MKDRPVSKQPDFDIINPHCTELMTALFELITRLQGIINDKDLLVDLLGDIKRGIHNHDVQLPDCLYKYRNVDQAIRDITNDTLRYTPSNEFDDPYDTVFSFKRLFELAGVSIDLDNENCCDDIDSVVSVMASVVTEEWRLNVFDDGVEDHSKGRDIFGKMLEPIRGMIGVSCMTTR